MTEDYTKVKALNNYIFVDPIDVGKEMKTGGIIHTVRDTTGIKPTRGKVLSIGPKVKSDIKVGDWITYVFMLDVIFKGKRFYFIKDEDVLAKLNGGE